MLRVGLPTSKAFTQEVTDVMLGAGRLQTKALRGSEFFIARNGHNATAEPFLLKNHVPREYRRRGSNPHILADTRF